MRFQRHPVQPKPHPRVLDQDFAQRFWRVLAQSERVFSWFQNSFISKCSPVHFF
jgi:Family of unknown function (DUF5996)